MYQTRPALLHLHLPPQAIAHRTINAAHCSQQPSVLICSRQPCQPALAVLKLRISQPASPTFSQLHLSRTWNTRAARLMRTCACAGRQDSFTNHAPLCARTSHFWRHACTSACICIFVIPCNIAITLLDAANQEEVAAGAATTHATTMCCLTLSQMCKLVNPMSQPTC